MATKSFKAVFAAWAVTEVARAVVSDVEKAFLKSTDKHTKEPGDNNENIVAILRSIASSEDGRGELAVKVLVRRLRAAEDIGDVGELVLKFCDSSKRLDRARTHFGLVFYKKETGKFLCRVDLHKDGLRLQMAPSGDEEVDFRPKKPYPEDVTLHQVVDFLSDQAVCKGYNLASWNCKHLCYAFWRFVHGKPIKEALTLSLGFWRFCVDLEDQYFDGPGAQQAAANATTAA